MTTDRRKYPRVKKPVYFQITSGSVAKNQALDISLEGILINSSRFYNTNQNISLNLFIANEQAIPCEAEVIWIYPRTKNAVNYKVGLHFTKMENSDRDKLSRYISE